MSCIVFADNQRTACIPVNPMNDSGPHYAVDSGKGVFAVIHQCIDQCAGIMAGRGMYHHPLRLVDHKQIFIFVKNIERNVFRLDIRRNHIRNRNGYDIVFTQRIAAFYGLLVNQNISFLRKLLNVASGKRIELVRQKNVQALIRSA